MTFGAYLQPRGLVHLPRRELRRGYARRELRRGHARDLCRLQALWAHRVAARRTSGSLSVGGAAAPCVRNRLAARIFEGAKRTVWRRSFTRSQRAVAAGGLRGETATGVSGREDVGVAFDAWAEEAPPRRDRAFLWFSLRNRF